MTKAEERRKMLQNTQSISRTTNSNTAVMSKAEQRRNMLTNTINPVVSTLKNASVIQTANDVKKPTLTYEQYQQTANFPRYEDQIIALQKKREQDAIAQQKETEIFKKSLPVSAAAIKLQTGNNGNKFYTGINLTEQQVKQQLQEKAYEQIKNSNAVKDLNTYVQAEKQFEKTLPETEEDKYLEYKSKAQQTEDMVEKAKYNVMAEKSKQHGDLYYGATQTLKTIGTSLADNFVNAGQFVKNAFKSEMQKEIRDAWESIATFSNPNFKSRFKALRDISDENANKLANDQIEAAKKVLRKYNIQVPDDVNAEYALKMISDIDEWVYKENKVEEATRTAHEKVQQENQALGPFAKTVTKTADVVSAMGPTILTNTVLPGVGSVPMFLSSAQSSSEQALKEGATYEQAIQRGILSGGMEVATEMIGGENLSKLTGIPTLFKKFGINTPNKLAQVLLDVGSEGLEEMVSTGVQPLIDRVTYNPNAEFATANDYWQSFKESILPTLFFVGANASINAINNYKAKAIEKVEKSNMTVEQKEQAKGEIEKGAQEMIQNVQNNTNLEETSPNTVQLEQNNVQNVQNLQKTVQSEPEIQEETVETNIGNIPIEEYRDIMAQQAGFNDYADMRRQGYKLGNKYDVEVQEVQEAQVDRRPTLDLRKIAQNYIEEGNISEQDKQILRETIDSATDAEIDGDLLHGLRNTIKEQEKFLNTAQNNNVEIALTRAMSNKDSKGKTILGKINDFAKNKIQQLLGKDVSNRQHVLNDNDIRHMLKEHGNPEVESRKGQIAVTEEDIKKIPDILENPTDIVIGTKNKDGDAIRYVKKYEDNNTFVVEVVPDKGNNLIIKTMWKKPIALADNLIPASTSETQGNLGNSTSNINNIIPTSQNYVNNNFPTQAEQQQAQQELRNKLPTEEQQNQEQEEKVAEILDDTSAQETNYKELAKDAVTTFRRLFVDSGADIAEIGKIANDETLYHMYNSAKQAGQSANHMISEAQTNWQGEKVGKSLVDIFEPIRQKGQDYYKEFEYYMYHLHNIDRMNLKGKALDELRLFEMEHPEFTILSQEELEKIAKQEIKEKSEIQVANEYLRLINKYEKATDKPVFGESITSEKSQNIVKQFESKYPEFKEYANDIRTWNANLQQYRIDTGLISQEQADLMNEMYPNYVPTYRDVNGISGATKNGNTVRIVNTIKKATGSNKDILPLHEQMARQVMQTVQAGRRNLLGMQLYNDVIKNSDKLGKYVQEIKTTKEDIDTDAEFEFEKPDLEGKFVIFDDGEKIEMQVSDGVLDGLKALTSAKWENNVWSKGARKVNSIFKKLVTEWNPFFIFKNASRDIQDAGFYSENAKKFYENYPQAWKEITSNSELWQKYLAMGGSDASLFDFEQGYVIPKDGIPANAMQKIKEANFLVEQAPRFAEFLRIYNESDKSYESLIKAMYGAADITVNFGRSGTWGKFINNNLVPFFNPAVQGTSKTLRTITGDGKVKGAKNYAKHMANIVGKGVLLGVTPTMINHILLSVFGGDDYDDLNERDKDLYYLIPIGDGKYFKVAKGRVLSVIGGFARRGFEYAMGDKDVFEGFGKFALEQTAPSNPFENNLYSPIQAVKNNTTWYGTPIENESLQNLRPSQRYDEGTTEFAKGLGKAINYSPKKIDYLIDAYGGVAADVLMPLNTKKAETSGFGKSFILDSTYSNKLSTDFYDTIEELTFDKNDDDPVAKMQLKYMNDVKEKAQDINKQIKDLQASDVENKEKLKQVRDLRKEVNTLQRDALSTYEKYGETANKYLNDKSITEIALRGTKEDSTEETKQQNIEKTVKLYTDKELFGAEYALKEYDKRLVEKQKESKLDADTFFKIYFAQKGITGDKNKITGKTQEGSEKKKKIEAMHKAVPKLTPWELNKLYELLN